MIAVDTNILVHAHRKEASLHEPACKTVKDLAESMRPWCICLHSLIEFYGIATHPKIWREASSPEQAFRQIHVWRSAPSLRILGDSAQLLESLESITATAKIQGPMIHDARIVACCLSNGIKELWTVDRDFSRFPDLKTRNPLIG